MLPRHILQRQLRSLSRYDVILALIPIPFAISVIAMTLYPIPAGLALGTASVIGAFGLIDALFLNPPTTAADHSRVTYGRL